MKLGKSKFDFQLKKIDALLQQAAKEENPAAWLFAHDMRTPMFMLESLSKLYATWHNTKTFTKLKDCFKSMEDILGAIDYYAAFAKEFAADDKIPAPVKTYFAQKVEEKTKVFKNVLHKEGWLNGEKLQKINAKLQKADWIEEAKETALLKIFYKEEIKKIEKFVSKTGFVFDDVEEQVHELRRKLRWLSIYPQALQGAIKLEKIGPLSIKLEKYLTPEIVNSPYNKFPVSDTQTQFLILEQNHFLALSWMIKELGKIKDSGLKINALTEAIQGTSLLNQKAALNVALIILGPDYPTTEKLLGQASVTVRQYFKEDNLKKIMPTKKQ
jgi:hypothetical protein